MENLLLHCLPGFWRRVEGLQTWGENKNKFASRERGKGAPPDTVGRAWSQKSLGTWLLGAK